MKKPPLEKDFQRSVLKELRAIPHSWFMKCNDTVTIGIPDIIGCIGIYFIAIELKTRSKLSEIQLYTLEKINGTGSLNFVMTPDNREEIMKFLRSLEQPQALRPKMPERIPRGALR